MPVKIKPISNIKAKLGIEVNGKVQRWFTHTCRIAMEKYVPKDEGNLRLIVDEQPSWITYEMPYARYQYYGMRDDGTHVVRNYTTPNTCPYWDRKMVSADMPSIIKKAQQKSGGK